MSLFFNYHTRGPIGKPLAKNDIDILYGGVFADRARHLGTNDRMLRRSRSSQDYRIGTAS